MIAARQGAMNVTRPFPDRMVGANLVSQIDFTYPQDSTNIIDCFGNRLNPTVCLYNDGQPAAHGKHVWSIDLRDSGIAFRDGTLTSYSRFTCLAWFITPSLPAAGTYDCFFGQNSATNGWALLLGGTSGKMELWTAAGSFTGTTATTAISTNTWYHIAAQYDGTNRKAFLNGAQDASAAASMTAVSSPVLAIGADPTNVGRTLPAGARCADFRFYSRALSLEEIKSIYLSAFLPEPPMMDHPVLNVTASALKFRKTLSSLGTRAGSRQLHIG